MTAVPAWGWEFAAVLCFAALATAHRQAWRDHPWRTAAAASLFIAGMHPLLDAMARHAVWLHALQSAAIHHAAPLLLALARAGAAPRPGRAARWLASPVAAAAAALSFAAMGWLWVRPDLHLLLMERPALYAAMKWGMAASGLLLCSAAVRPGDAGYWPFSLAVALPQAAIGVLLLASPPLYLMPDCLSADAWVRQGWAGRLTGLDPRADQAAGGVLLLAAAFTFLAADLWRHARPRQSASRVLSMSAS